MNSFIKTLAFCALLGASGGAYAAPIYFPDGQFNNGQGSWGEAGPATFSYPATNGNPGGYGVMDTTVGNWGVLVSSNNSTNPLDHPIPAGITPGNGYTFLMDMRFETGSPSTAPNKIGKFKLEWFGPVSPNFVEIQPTLINAGWNTYSFNIIVPAAATGMKIVPVHNESGAIVGFDNVGFESVPYFVAPTPPPPPTDVVHQNNFNVEGTNWAAPTGGGAGVTSSRIWSNSEGNPPGATILTAANPNGVPNTVAFAYTATGIDFGDGPVQISFDSKLLNIAPGTDIHLRYNGNFVGAIQNGLNTLGYTTYTNTFNLNQGFLSTTLTLQFEITTGAVPNSGGSIIIDNIVVKTNLPGSAPPTTASIASGKLVDWDVVNPDNSHQPQESAVGGTNDVDWTNLGPPITNPAVSSIFDSTPSAFYRVQETSPTILDNQVFNPGFEFTANNSPADAWNTINEVLGTVTIQQSFPGGYLPTGGSNMLVLEVQTPAGPTGPGGAEIRSDQFPVVEGERYDFSFSAANAITSGVSGAPQYAIYFYDTFGSIIETPIIGLLREPPFNVTDEWTRVETTVEIPADVIGVQIGFAVPTGPLSSETFVTLIDDVSFDTGDVVTPSVTNTIPSTANPAVDVSWKTVTGRDYQVESSTSLQGWGNFGDSVAGDGSIFSVTDLITPPRKFYRVLETSP